MNSRNLDGGTKETYVVGHREGQVLQPAASRTVKVSPPHRSPSRFPALVAAGALLFAVAWAGISCIAPSDHRFAVRGEACVTCHREDYDRSKLPGHDEFPLECANCHDESHWQPAEFPNHERFFPLHGAHAELECTKCHTTDVEPGTTPKECVGCHRKDYDSSPYPGHQDFSTTCTDCHTTKAWKPASGGTHPEKDFPIATGPHKEVECMECHDSALGPNGKGNTDCVQCHKRSKWDGEHHEVRNYPSGPAPVNFCLDCHTRGTHDDD